jgi:hypothetical protein
MRGWPRQWVEPTLLCSPSKYATLPLHRPSLPSLRVDQVLWSLRLCSCTM